MLELGSCEVPEELKAEPRDCAMIQELYYRLIALQGRPQRMEPCRKMFVR